MGVVGVILAGGSGQRLGTVRKADLRLANVPLHSWLEKSLAGQCEDLVISTGAVRGSFENYQNRVPDDPERVQGPAAGLLAGALWCRRNRPGALMLSVSVDTPFFPGDFVERARPLMTQGITCVVAAFDLRHYPTNALWHPDRLAEDLAALPADPKGPRLRDIENRLGAVKLDYSQLAPHDPFAGINTLPDLLALSTRQKALASLSD